MVEYKDFYCHTRIMQVAFLYSNEKAIRNLYPDRPMTLRTRYRCEACKTVHDDEDSAFLCCMPTVTEVFACPVCDKNYDQKHHAIECCSDPRNTELTPAELEALGQQRLF